MTRDTNHLINKNPLPQCGVFFGGLFGGLSKKAVFSLSEFWGALRGFSKCIENTTNAYNCLILQDKLVLQAQNARPFTPATPVQIRLGTPKKIKHLTLF